MKKISVVLPCFNESENLPLLVPEIVKNIPKSYDYEIICIDDGSTDSTKDVIMAMASQNKKIKGLSFYKRSGHQAALVAGIKYAKGEAVITMDSDFQHPPKLIPKFIKLWEDGFDLVNAKKQQDKSQSIFLKIERKIGYFIWSKITDNLIPPGVSDFRLMSHKVAAYVTRSKEKEIFLRGLVTLAAKNKTEIPYKVGQRKFGKSSYTLKMFANMFINGFISFSTKPIRIASLMGLAIAFITGTFLIYDLAYAILTGRKIIQGYVSIVFLMLILNGFIIFYMGILGEYMGVIFKEVKKRPHYLINKKINL